MLAGTMRSGGSDWQHRDGLLSVKEPLKAPSPDLPRKSMPSTNFEPTYQYEVDSPNKLKAFKVAEEQGRVRVVSQFAQGFHGRGAERYPSEEDGFETYVGTYGDGRRHGRGAFHDKEGGITQSLFKQGKPHGEGTKLGKDGKLYRTHGGVVDGDAISLDEAEAIAKNSGLPAPPSDYVSQILSAHSPLPGAKRREPLPRPSPQAATDYTTESKSAFAGNPEGYGKVHSISFYERPGNTDTFLARLQIAEQSDNQKRMSLIPRVG